MTHRTIQLIDDLMSELAKLRGAAGSRGASQQGEGDHLPPSSPRATTRVHRDLLAHPGSGRSGVAKRTGLHPRTVSKALQALKENGEAVRVGNRRGSKWLASSTVEELAKGGPSK